MQIASNPLSPQASPAADSAPYSLTVEPLATRQGRYSWVISHAAEAPVVSQESYATRRETLAAGDKILKKMVSAWRAGNRASGPAA